MKPYQISPSHAQKTIVFAGILLIASSIFGGPLGVFARGERHVLLLLMVTAAIYHIWSGEKSMRWRESKFYFTTGAPTLFFLISLLWIGPLGCQTQEQCAYGLIDAQSLALLPATTLIFLALTECNINLKTLGRWIVNMCAILGLIQAVLWIFLRVNPVPHDVIYHYVDAYFRTCDSIFILEQPSYQGSYFRVVWISSYWLLFAVFIAPLVQRNSTILILQQMVFGFAIIASYTRGIWLGLIIGMILFTVLINALFFLKTDRNIYRELRSEWHTSLAGLALSVLLVVALDWTQGSSGLLMSRLYLNPKHTSVEQLAIKDESAIERKTQVIKLIEMWKESPILGHGYGAYMKDHFSHDDRPFLYEMVPFALLMKLGILGFGIYLAFLAFILIRLFRIAAGSASSIALLSGLTGYLIQVHTNPVFYSFTGMLIFSLFIFLWLSLEHNENRAPNLPHAN